MCRHTTFLRTPRSTPSWLSSVNTADPLELFDRHENGENEYRLVVSIAGERTCNDVLNLIDSGYLLRWQELTANGLGPEELPPLRPRSGPERLFP